MSEEPENWMSVVQSGAKPFSGCGIGRQRLLGTVGSHVVATLETEAGHRDFDVAAWYGETRRQFRERMQGPVDVESGADSAVGHVAAAADVHRVDRCRAVS